MLEILILIGALAGLWLGAELVVRGVLHIGKHFKISEMFLGLTLLAFGTDLPELFISISGSLYNLGGTETSGLLMGNIIGSVFAQGVLVLGILAIIGIIKITEQDLYRDGLMVILGVVIVFLFGIDGVITATDGLIMIGIYVIYLLSVLREERIYNKIQLNNFSFDLFWTIISLVAGFAILIISSEFTIRQALFISNHYDIAQSFIGILIVGLGTSLPELITAIVAVRKKAGKLALGNLLGSNIFDLLFVLGIGSVISNIAVSKNLLNFDIPALFAVLFVTFLLLRSKKRMSKKEGYVLLGMFFLYVIIKFILL